MSADEFEVIIVPGEFLENQSFSFGDFEEVVVDIPKEFLKAAYGYGHYYGRHYGHT